ncbi:MAG TPA: response regulator transcription factor, partial [Opitutaceae bacterium]
SLRPMANRKKLSVFLADDHAVVREGLKRLIDAEEDMQVAGEAANGPDTVDLVRKLKPDVLVLDLSLPGLTGPQVARELKAADPSCFILVLTVHEDTSYIREILQAGATGYVLKRSASDELVNAIRSVANGNLHIDPHVTGKLMNTLIPSKGNSSHPFGELSARETDVLRLIAQGYSNREIAARLEISMKTVETYKARSMEKLGLRSRVDLVRAAAQRGWLRHESFNE